MHSSQPSDQFQAISDNHGPLRVWDWPSPGREYCIGVDAAEGIEGGDYSCALVFDVRTRWPVATWHGIRESVPFAFECYSLGKFYNEALLVVERKSAGIAVLQELIHNLKYPRLYRHQRKADGGRVKANVQRYGFDTNAQTKRLMVDHLRAWVQQIPHVPDSRFISEARTWILDAHGEPMTMDDANDDWLMAAAMAIFAMNEIWGSTWRPPVAQAPTQVSRKKGHSREHWRDILASIEGGGQGPANNQTPVEELFL